MSIPSILRYYRTCYEADRGKNTLWNIFSSDIQFLKFFPEFNFSIEEEFAVLSPDDNLKYLNPLRAEVQTYRREKKLLLCSFFIVGKAKAGSFGNQKRVDVCAPLIFTDAEFNHHNPENIIAEYGTARWNYPLLYWLLGGRENTEAFENEVAFDKNFFDSLFSQLNNFSDWELIREDVSSITESDKNRMVKQSTNNALYLVPASALLLAKRGINARGVIDEVKQLEARIDFSAPLKRLLGEAPIIQQRARKNPVEHYIPGTLSAAQKKILKSVCSHDLSLLYGPPGTGKSHTIASIALEHCMLGYSVLVVSSNEHAVDVVRDKLISTFGVDGSSVVRCGTQQYLKELKKHIDGILKVKPNPGTYNESKKLYKVAKKHLATAWESYFDFSLNEIALGDALLSPPSGFWQRYVSLPLMFRRSQKHHRQQGSVFNSLSLVFNAKRHFDVALANWLSENLRDRINHTIRRKKNIFKEFRSILGARNSKLQQQRIASMRFDALLGAMPVWLSSLDALHHALPLQSGLFDLVIIDEASMCDITSSIPALYRGKRALIVGDDKQLRHFSFLSRKKQSEIGDRIGLEQDQVLSYRDSSVLDLAIKSSEIDGDSVLLDEHFRSEPNIIRFSNSKFYGQKLKVMQAGPHTNSIRSVKLIRVEQGCYEDSINRPEAGAIVSELKKIIQEQHLIPTDKRLSIGVLSFFSDQLEFLKKQIQDNISDEALSSHNIFVGTPYNFQGEERDLMMLSTVVDQNTSLASYTYMNRADVFNVGITRARQRQLVFHSLDVSDIPQSTLLFEYLRSASVARLDSYHQETDLPESIESLIFVLRSKDVMSFAYYPIAGATIDILLLHQGICIAMDLIGFPGITGQALDQNTIEIMERANLRVFPLAYSEWEREPAKVVEALLELFKELNDATVVNKLSVVNEDQYWIKLLASYPNIAQSVRGLEERLIVAQMEALHEVLGHLIDQHQTTEYVLREKLNPDEITFMRQIASLEQLLLACLERIERMSLIETLDATTAETNEVHQHIEEVEEGIHAMKELGLKWAQQESKSRFGQTDLNLSLKDMNNITNIVDKIVKTDQ